MTLRYLKLTAVAASLIAGPNPVLAQDDRQAMAIATIVGRAEPSMTQAAAVVDAVPLQDRLANAIRGTRSATPPARLDGPVSHIPLQDLLVASLTGSGRLEFTRGGQMTDEKSRLSAEASDQTSDEFEHQ
ncbi:MULTISPECIES: hypothetical protein [Alphaproteobacteria]|jgi:hypothetical protein|uniref:TonB-dependent receptor n=1 Tax=Sphingobium yanoikuyae TaxID=13690 RepID=A0A430BDV8_SPHYA|nr:MULTISPECIES: hypothetical protein [Alphaproteobacteria]RSU47071.1 hypothetical protein DAH51_25160 [Sphingobium yanoikuyae]TAJ31959.1 MAG: hypothetical protein EPO59_06365 [Bosea sp. (in: a-proteobacteria)]